MTDRQQPQGTGFCVFRSRLSDPRSFAFIRGWSSPGRCRSCLPIDPANGLQIRYDHRDQLCWFQHLAVGPPVHHPALDQAQVVHMESEYQRAVWVGFDDLARVPLLLGNQAGVGSGEPEHDVVISVAPDRAEGLRHVIPGPEAVRAEEARARLHHRTHPLDLEQPDVVPQAAMTNQAPVVVGSKYQVVGIDGPPLRLVPSRSPVDHTQLAWFKSGLQLRGGWGRRPKSNAPRSEASALGARWLLPARSQPPNYRHLRGWQRGSSRPTPQ